jgi:integrase
MTKLTKTSDANLYLDESGIFIWREHINGENHWRSTKERSIQAARTAVKRFRTEAGEGKALRRQSFSTIFDDLEIVQAAKAKNTLVSWRTAMSHLRPWFCGEKLVTKEHSKEVNGVLVITKTKAWEKPEDTKGRCEYLTQFEKDYETLWAAYKTDQARLTPGRKLGHDRRALLMALKRAKAKKWIKREFKNNDLQLLESSDPVGRLLEDDEVAKLLPEVAKHRMLYVQVMTALFMGMRKDEILKLRVTDVNLRRGQIDLTSKSTKTRRGRTVEIHDRVKPLLKELIDQAKAKGGQFLFPSQTNKKAPDWNKPQVDVSGAWTTARDAAGVDCRFHDLRHTAMSWMIAEGIPLPAVHLQTGASMKVILRVYAHLDQKMREKIRSFNCGKFVGAL